MKGELLGTENGKCKIKACESGKVNIIDVKLNKGERKIILLKFYGFCWTAAFFFIGNDLERRRITRNEPASI